MSSLSRHLSAMQAAAAVTLTTAALTALPLLAADQYDESYYANQVVQTFQKMGAMSTDSYVNTSMDTSGFDFATFFSDTCYRPTEFDMQGCKDKFGPYANLKNTYESGKLASILRRVPYLKAVAALVPQSAAVSSVSSSAMSSSSSSSMSSATESGAQQMTTSSASSDSYHGEERTDRAAQVWTLCVKKFEERKGQAACYQRNIRLIMERTEPVTENVVY